LAGGPNSQEGRLEVRYSGRWGTVCDDSFTDTAASVACRSLGFRYVSHPLVATFFACVCFCVEIVMFRWILIAPIAHFVIKLT